MPVPYRYTNLAVATVATANRFVTTTNMIVGAYTLANTTMPTMGARLITVTHTTVAVGTDTLGTIDVVGTDLAGNVLSETITPLTDAVATGTKWFRTVTSVTGVGWVIAGGNDTIVVGCGARVVAAEGSGVFHAININTTAAGAVTVKDSLGTIAILKTSVAEGSYVYDVQFSGYLELVLAAASDVTASHYTA